MLLDGIHVPLTTPFAPDGRLNLRKLEGNVERLSRSPVAGLLVLGPNGEATTLSETESAEALSAAIAAAAPEKVMLAGIARDGVAGALALADHAAHAGYDAIVLGLPAALAASEHSAATPRGAITFFQAIADRSPLPLVLASDRRHQLSLEAIAELALHPRILGLIESSGRLAELRRSTSGVKRSATVTTVFAAVTGRMLAASATAPGGLIGAESLGRGATAFALASSAPALRTRTRETGFQVLSGHTASMLDGLRAGALGAVPRLAACAPQACFEVLAGWKDGDTGLAEEKQHRLLAAAAFIEHDPGRLKFACDLNGYFGGRPRLPFLPASGAERAAIEDLMRDLKN